MITTFQRVTQSICRKQKIIGSVTQNSSQCRIFTLLVERQKSRALHTEINGLPALMC